MKFASTIGVLCVALFATGAWASDAAFERNLNECLTRSPGALVQCAQAAGIRTGSDHVRIKYDVALAPKSPTREAKIVEDCSDDGYDICDIYDCKEEGNMSICNFVGTTCGEYWCD